MDEDDNVSTTRYLDYNLETLKEIFALFKKSDASEVHIANVWDMALSRSWGRRQDFNRRPLKEGRDNKDVMVGGGGSNRSKIRFPKKVRKTAWKRFYKLFPSIQAKLHGK